MVEIPKTIVQELKNTINNKKEMVAKKQEEKQKEQELKRIAALPVNVVKKELEKIAKEINIKISRLIYELNEKINGESWNSNFKVETYFPMASTTCDEATKIVVSILEEKIKIILKDIIEDIKVDVCFEKEEIYEDDSDDLFFASRKLLYSYNNVILKLSINFE